MLAVRSRGFATSVTPTQPPEMGIDFPAARSGPEFMTAEKEGNLTVLKCRTPREAFLVAEELETADILVMFPNEEMMLKEFQSHGFVSIRVSARSYEAARELRTVIEREHWEERARQPLSLALCLNNPVNVPARIHLIQMCRAMKQVHPEVVAAFRDKLQMLQRENPLAEPAQGVCQRMLNEVLAA